ncbi:hypothetical protein ACFWIA_32950 [Streptomyces sp. NPDC127068]|uniref:hypothetical protein n=1 Tax=Streptomyces sp. NPDC127068 TaxID=3347127 RepID=UPI00364C0E44
MDEVGYLELNRRSAEMLFQIFTPSVRKRTARDRLQRGGHGLAKDVHRSTALRAAVDRNTLNAILIESYRLERTKANARVK